MSAFAPSIYFHYLVDPFYFPNRSLTKTFLFSILKKHSKRIKIINYIFCSDEYLLSLNEQHLKHDYYTDIITFELSEANEALLADVYISTERAKENARNFNVTYHGEIVRLLIHGTLHLCGYKDKKPGEIEEMRRLETKYLDKWFHVKHKAS